MRPRKFVFLFPVLCVLLLFSCKKEKKQYACIENGEIMGGIIQEPSTAITFYIKSDKGCGYYDFEKMRNIENGKEYTVYSGLIDRYFSYSEPDCRKYVKGTLQVNVPSGYTYEYTLKCTAGNKAVGRIDLDCSGQCRLVEIK